MNLSLHDNNSDNRYELAYLKYVHFCESMKSMVKSFLINRDITRYFVSAATQVCEKHPLSRFISYSLDFYEIVNHALWYYYIAYLVYCYCYITTIRNATRLSIFTSTFLYLSSSLHMKDIVIKYHEVKFVYEFLSVSEKKSRITSNHISNHAWLLKFRTLCIPKR